ncbi:MAG TPA: helix-turn-helix domain-containing protein [Candidatus Dormibacteraeota bacterium]|nr:helix-turn-helix domain-containing protein [Candidatus Dormibacteraeota bacterium]
MAVGRRILDRAPAVLARDTKATVADFARAAGVSRASFYRHFKSREALLEALDVPPEPGARERILAAAGDVVGARGLQALSMDELADRAEVSRATLYRLFPGKAALLLAMVHAYSPLDPVTEVLTARSNQAPDVLMPEIARTAYRAVAGRTGLMRAVFFEVSGLSPEVEVVAREALVKVVGLLAGYIGAQTEAGRLRRMHPLLALQSFIGPIFFHILTRPVAEKVLHLDIGGERAVTELAEAWLRAMAPVEEGR